MPNFKQISLKLIVITAIFAASSPAFGQTTSQTPRPIVAPTSPAPAPIAPPVAAGPVAAPAPVAPLDRVRAEMLNKDLADLTLMLTGRWDNELQSFFEPELNVPLAQRHDRIHTIIRPLANTAFGANAFYVEYRLGGESGPVVRQRIWSLSVDSQLAALRLVGFSPKEGKLLEGAWRDPALLASIKPADFDPITGCDVIWRRRADGFSGETRPGACKVVTADNGQRILTVTERHDLSSTTWDVRDIGVDDRGTRVFGSADNAPTRSRRAIPFVCWAGSLKGSVPVTASDLIVHDQGGVATSTLTGATPSSVTLRLRNVDWPIGQNRPSLTLYLMTGSDPNAKAYAWSEPDAKRIALDVNGTQVSCTRDESAIWR